MLISKLFNMTFVHVFYPPLWGAWVMKCTFDCRLPVGKTPKTRRHLYMCRCWQGSLLSCQRPFYFHKDMLVSVLQYGVWIIRCMEVVLSVFLHDKIMWCHTLPKLSVFHFYVRIFYTFTLFVNSQVCL